MESASGESIDEDDLVDPMSKLRFDIDRRTYGRGLGLLLVLVMFAPVLNSAAFHGPAPASVADDVASNETAGRLFVISAQGDELTSGKDSRIVIISNETRRTVWETTRYPTYFDVDPLNESTLLYSAKAANQTTYAVIQNWKTGEIYDRFEIPKGTHDIDYLGDDQYALTDGVQDHAVVVNRSTGETVWAFDFRKHYPPSAGGGNSDDYSGDYTHLNDIDAVERASAFLLSPRNFDRVMLVDRETKTVLWTLGAEDDYDTLYQQHNPELLATSPPTILVADSENDRAVEYRRQEGEWKMIWEYKRDLEWPRDADRLPNGNTLIVDSKAAMEVTPAREVVWRIQVPKFLYDIEVIQLGDEPGGPSMVDYRDEFESADHEVAVSEDRSVVSPTFDRIYATAKWVMPWWVSKLDFATAVLGILTVFVWGNFEISRIGAAGFGLVGIDGRTASQVSRPSTRLQLGMMALAVLLGQIALWQSVASGVSFHGELVVQWSRWNPFYHAVGILTLVEGSAFLVTRAEITISDRRQNALRGATRSFAFALTVLGAALLVLALGIRPETVQISSPAQVFSIAAASIILGGRRVLPWQRYATIQRSLTIPFARPLIGVGLLIIAIGILIAGMQSLDLTGGYLGFGLLLALLGGGWIQRGAREAAEYDRGSRSAALRGLWYLLRILVIGLATGVFLRLLGLGTVGGLEIGLHLLNPMYLALLIVVLQTIMSDTLKVERK